MGFVSGYKRATQFQSGWAKSWFLADSQYSLILTCHHSDKKEFPSENIHFFPKIPYCMWVCTLAQSIATIRLFLRHVTKFKTFLT